MGKLYLWERPKGFKNFEIGDYDEEKSIDRFKFLAGKRLLKDESVGECIFTFEMSKEEASHYDSLLNNSASPLVNEKIRELLICLAPEDVQFFPAKVICSDGELEGYYLVNVTYRLKAVDHPASEYSILDLPDGAKMMMSIKKLTLKEEIMGNHHIIREGETLHVVVSQTLVNVFEKEKIKGVRMLTSDEYYGELNQAYRRL